MSQVPPKQPQPTPPAAPSPAPRHAEGGVDLPTLVITALASAVAAYVCSKVWAPGTLASAAFTPVLVALVKEALRRPTEVVTTVVPVPAVAPRLRRRLASPDAPTAVLPPGAVHGADRPGADMPPPAIVAVDPPAVTTTHTRARSIHWRVAVITGLLGFAICAALYTVPELVTGSAASGGGRTTLFGGGGGGTVQHTTTVKTKTVVVPGETVTQTAPPEATTTPAVTAPTTATTPTVTAPATTATTAPTTPTTPATTDTAPTTTPTTPAP